MCGETCFIDFEEWWDRDGRFKHPGSYSVLRHVFRWMMSPRVRVKVSRKKTKWIKGEAVVYDTTPLTVFAHGGKTQLMVAGELNVEVTTIRMAMKIIKSSFPLVGED